MNMKTATIAFTLFLVMFITVIVMAACTPGDAGPQAPAAQVVIGDGGLGQVTALGTFSIDPWSRVTVYFFRHEGRDCYVARELYDGHEEGGVGIGISCVP